jgi:hypothetical protein
MKLVLNKTHGAFHLSDEMLFRLAYLKDINLYKQDLDGWTQWFTFPDFRESSYWDPYTWDRTDPDLAAVVEELEPEGLQVLTIDSGQRYRIREYDGKEWLEFPTDIHWEIAT